MSMISNALITGGTFSQHIDQRHTQKSAMDRLQEAVAQSAFHNSGERFDPPKCHPNTRVAVLDKIERWALRTDPETLGAPILWLSGAAGAGKSAISQTLAERFHSRGLLMASFFFGRSDATRNHSRSLIATILYQIYSLLPPVTQRRVLEIIDNDPLIFTKSLLAQFDVLIAEPLLPLVHNGYWANVNAPRLVIIDGLDECLEREMQRNILLMLSASLRKHHLPLIFLLASRPEHDIHAGFGSPELISIHTRLFLDDTYLPDRDIELFLRDQFRLCKTAHPFKNLIPADWPSDKIVKSLTTKSSGQFIYASVVAKYIQSTRHRPHHRLEIIMNLRPASRDLPFSELDALYTHILSCAQDIDAVLKILSFDIIYGNLANVDEIEYILCLEQGELPILLCDLASVIGFRQGVTHGLRLKIHHASLSDYLLDQPRSQDFYIDKQKYGPEHAACCFQILSQFVFGSPEADAALTALYFFEYNHRTMALTDQLYTSIKAFSISRVFDMALTIRHSVYPILQPFIFRFLPALFNFLAKTDSPRHTELFRQHQLNYDAVLRQSLEGYPLETTYLTLALVARHRDLPIGAFHDGFGLQDRIFDFSDGDLVSLQLGTLRTGDRGYMQYLADFLRDVSRSRQFSVGPKMYVYAAMQCLRYACNHAAFTRKLPPQLSSLYCQRRKYTPWKWRRRAVKEDVRGYRITPWLWLRRPTRYTSVSRKRVLPRNPNQLVYIHSQWVDISMPSEFNDPVVVYRVNLEKFYLALTYLIYFLPRAAKLDDLVTMCRNLTLASLSQKFPRESAKVRSLMHTYAEQWG